MRRKLAVILASDVAGYSRLVSMDEETTIARFAKLKQTMAELVASYHGRIFNTAGDAVLAEFPSAVDAVRCAIEIQDSARARNLAYKPEQHMLLRIGVAIGDVLIQDEDLLGDGVNVAARLEGIARPGGICVSEEVYSHVGRNISFAVSDLGAQSLKNIAHPVRVFEIQLPGMSALAGDSPAAAPDMPVAPVAAAVLLPEPDMRINVDVMPSGRWHGEQVAPERSAIALPLERSSGVRQRSYMRALVLTSGIAVLVAALALWFVLPKMIVQPQGTAAVKTAPPATRESTPPVATRPTAPPAANSAAAPAPALRPAIADPKPAEIKPADPKPAEIKPDLTVPAPPAASTQSPAAPSPAQPTPAAPTPSVAAAPPQAPQGPLSQDFADISAEALMVRASVAEMPFLRDDARAKVAAVYGQQPLHRALAVSLDGQGYWSLRWGHETPEAAQADAMQRCEETAGSGCGVYALDDAVVWPSDAVPLPPATVLKPRVMGAAFDPSVLPGQGRDQRVQLARALAQPGGHSAVVLAPGGRATWFTNQSSQREAMRRALERCGFLAKAACLPVAVDGLTLTGFPATGSVSKVDADAAFLRGKVSDAVLERYQAAADWRAVAIGRSNRPSVVTDQPSEAAAIAAAVAACARGDSDCRVRMVGPFVIE